MESMAYGRRLGVYAGFQVFLFAFLFLGGASTAFSATSESHDPFATLEPVAKEALTERSGGALDLAGMKLRIEAKVTSILNKNEVLQTVLDLTDGSKGIANVIVVQEKPAKADPRKNPATPGVLDLTPDAEKIRQKAISIAENAISQLPDLLGLAQDIENDVVAAKPSVSVSSGASGSVTAIVDRNEVLQNILQLTQKDGSTGADTTQVVHRVSPEGVAVLTANDRNAARIQTNVELDITLQGFEQRFNTPLRSSFSTLRRMVDESQLSSTRN